MLGDANGAPVIPGWPGTPCASPRASYDPGTMKTPIALFIGLFACATQAATWSPVTTAGAVYIDPTSIVDLMPGTVAVMYRIDRADRMVVTGRAVVACGDGQHRLAAGRVTEPSGASHDFLGSPEWRKVTEARTAGNDIHRFVCGLQASR